MNAERVPVIDLAANELPNTGAALHLKEILVPIDFSGPSLQALRRAVWLAAPYKARLTLLHVVQLWSYPVLVDTPLPVLDSDRTVAERHERLTALGRQSFIPPDLEVRTLVETTDAPYHQISETARVLAVDLIVIATHGNTGLKHILLGSTAERVVRHAPCPVLTVPSFANPANDLEIGPRPIKRILWPTDFSKNSVKALQYAVPFAERFGASLTLLHVFEPMAFPTDGGYGLETLQALNESSAQSAQAQLTSLAGRIQRPTVPVECAVRYGRPFKEITGLAKERDMDLIVLCTHGYTGLPHLLLGSTSERVVQHAPCVVLTVRQYEHEFV